MVGGREFVEEYGHFITFGLFYVEYVITISLWIAPVLVWTLAVGGNYIVFLLMPGLLFTLTILARKPHQI